jgi:hypothetical protein
MFLRKTKLSVLSYVSVAVGVQNDQPSVLSFCIYILLGQYATSRIVAGSIPDEVIGFFN